MRKGPKVLVVDDERPIRQMCERVLLERGMQVETAVDGDEALVRLKQHEMDMVLTDITMPGRINGVCLAEEVKRCHPETDVVLMTGFPSLDTAVPGLKNGAVDYLVKPFSAGQLAEVVSRRLRERTLMVELSRERRLREELEAAYAELQKVERLKESILARVGHELWTPLTSIQLAMKFLSSPPENDHARRAGDILRANVGRLETAVDSLLMYASLRDRNFDFYREPVDIKRLWKELIEHYRPLTEKYRLKVETSFPSEPEWIWGGRKLLERALGHLFVNAAQFNRPGGSIRVDLRSSGKNVETTVTDTGEGVPPNKLDKIFDSFYQAAEYLTRQVDGLGLGLAIVREIAERHRGHVRVESREGVGSRFRVVLPRRSVEIEKFFKNVPNQEEK